MSERYTHAVPSSTKDQPDISLHDHARGAAALAAAMLRWHEYDGSLSDTRRIRDRTLPKFRFLVGDLSGIQSTLFQLKHEGVKGVNRILRARSFYMSLLTEAAALDACLSLDLPAFSLLQAAGGRFLMLVPNTADAEGQVKELKQRVEAWMWQRWRGQLALNLVLSDPFSGEHLLGGGYGQLVARLAVQVENQKLQAFSTCLRPIHEDADYQRGWVCDVCGVRPALEREKTEHGTPVYRCAACEDEHRLGSLLPKARTFAWVQKGSVGAFEFWGNLSFKPYCGSPGSWNHILSAYEVFHAEDPGRCAPELPLRFVANYVPRLGQKDHGLKAYLQLSEEAQRCQPGDLKLFEHIASDDVIEDGNLLRGVRRLGVLKGDVDNLGQIFQRGLGSMASLSRVAGLSRMMDFFFSGYLPWLLGTEFPSTYTVYAGGDDFLLIGPWKQTLRLALRLREAFGRWVGQNPNVTLSAGVELIKENEPLNRSAEAAEARLEKAKSRLLRTGSGLSRPKDAVCAIDESPQPWEVFRGQLDQGERLLEYLRHRKVSQALVYRLLGIDEDRLEVESALSAARTWVDLGKASWRARWGYELVRTVLQSARDGRSQKERDEIAEFLCGLLGLTRSLSRTESPAPPARTAITVALYSFRSSGEFRREKYARSETESAGEVARRTD